MKELNRRTFMKSSAVSLGAAASACTTTPTRLAAAGKRVGPNDTIRVALIGCGGMGIGDLMTFLAYDDMDCPVVCDVDESHLGNAVKLVEARRYHKPDTVTDFRRIMDRDDVDACLIATPDHWHALPMINACQAGMDVYVEKPLGKTIEEGRAMREAARKHERVVQMGTQWRSGEHYREAVEFIHSGKLGKVRLVRVWAYLDWVGGIGNPADTDPPESVNYDMWLGPAPNHMS